jgi:hypothetical protein
MSSYQRFLAAFVVAFCLTGVVAVTAANNAYKNPFIEGSQSPFSLSNQLNQNSDNLPIEPSPFVDLLSPVIPTSHLFMRGFSFDLYGEPTVYTNEDLSYPEDYIYNGSITVCGNCGHVPPGSFSDPLREDQYMPAPVKPLIGQSPFMEEAWQRDRLSILINCCGPEFLSVSEFP